MLKNLIKKIITTLKPGLIPIIFLQCKLAQKWAYFSYKQLMFFEWGLGSNPEHFNHQIDLYYLWPRTHNPLWLERGIFGGLALKGGKTLELACGDGFNAKYFYSHRVSEIIACDFDPTAINFAKTNNAVDNVQYVLCDIRSALPGKDAEFDNVIWDAAIEHFYDHEIVKILQSIKVKLRPEGVLSGYTIVEREDGVKHLHQHEYEFKGKDDLMSFLAPFFKSVTIFETIYRSRHNLYFWASDGVLPFQENWPNCLQKIGPKV